jgi:hypothetical protein
MFAILFAPPLALPVLTDETTTTSQAETLGDGDLAQFHKGPSLSFRRRERVLLLTKDLQQPCSTILDFAESHGVIEIEKTETLCFAGIRLVRIGTSVALSLIVVHRRHLVCGTD